MTELYGQRIQTTVQTEYLPFVVDTILGSNVLFQRVVRAAKKWSGRTLRVPIKYAKNTTGTSFSGYDSLSTSATNNRVNLTFTPKAYQITSSLPLDEVTANMTAGEAQILDLVDLTLKSDSQDAADDVGTLFYADGSGNGGKDFDGLGNIVDKLSLQFCFA